MEPTPNQDLPITDAELAELQRLAEGATPGPWELPAYQLNDKKPVKENDHNRIVDIMSGVKKCGECGTADSGYIVARTFGNAQPKGQQMPNAAYIAAASPTAVLALLARLRAAEATLAAVGTAIKEQQDKAVADGIGYANEHGQDSEQFAVASARLMEVQMIGCAMEGSPTHV